MAPCLLVTKSSPPSGGAQKIQKQTSSKTMILGMGSIVRQFWPRCKSFSSSEVFSQLAGVGFDLMTNPYQESRFAGSWYLDNQTTN